MPHFASTYVSHQIYPAVSDTTQSVLVFHNSQEDHTAICIDSFILVVNRIGYLSKHVNLPNEDTNQDLCSCVVDK